MSRLGKREKLETIYRFYALESPILPASPARRNEPSN
jgi:hypothetical protein